MRWVRVLVIGAVVVIGGGVAAVSAINTWMFGEGEIHVLAGQESVTVQMDGKPLGEVDEAGVGRFHVEQGAHTLTLTDASGAESTVQVDVGGWTEVIVTTPGRCIAELDVTNGIYNSLDPDWAVKEWYGEGAVADMPSNGGTSFVDLPDEISQSARARLLVSIPCEMEGETEMIGLLAQARMLNETE